MKELQQIKNIEQVIIKYLDILNTTYMMIDKYGNDVSFDNRLEDIKNI